MSRKSREDKSSWKLPSIYAFTGSYGPFRAKTYDAIDGAVVLIHNSSNSCSKPDCGCGNESSGEEKKDEEQSFYYSHPMHSFAGQLQQQLLGQDQSYDPEDKTLIVVDVSEMFEDVNAYEDAIVKEDESQELTKVFGKSILRSFRRMLLQNITLVAKDNLCGLLLKMYQVIQRLDPDMVSELRLIHPKLSSKFVNTNLVAYSVASVRSSVAVNLIVEKSSDPRVDVIRAIFPNGSTKAATNSDQNWLLSAFDDSSSKDARTDYDPDYCNMMGKSLFLSQMTIDMNRHTKQYERNCVDITSKLTEKVYIYNANTETGDLSSIDWMQCEREIGALVLRGNRCVLVRSLKGEWDGMRIPSVVPERNESPQDAAIRAVVESTEVEASEVVALPEIVAPVYVYGPNGRPVVMQLYPLYAIEPPAEGPLEDADLEDDESPYDWYLYSNAVKRLDGQSIPALQAMALSLVQAANVGLVPCKWGGVFGQELQIGCPSSTPQTNAAKEQTQQSLLKAKVEEWVPSTESNDMLQYVREAKQIVEKRFDEKLQKQRKLPVTLLSGFLGSGKTTLLSHILTNYDGIKIAILVNDMGEINIDAALVKSTVSIRQKEEHMVELSNGCICCTLREDLLVEVAKIASSEECYDYLIIESTGVSEPMPVAETFTFEDDSGLRLGDLAEIDTLVTVVDGSRFLSELDSLEKLQERNWHADPEDERTISHLLCDQVEFANTIVLNKCDLMEPKNRDKVKNLIRTMNPAAKLVESVYSAVPLDTVLGTRLFSMSEAEKHDNWLKEARIGEHTPETEEYGIGSFTFRAIRPFSPLKFSKALEAMLEKSTAPFDTSTVLRAKGFVWLANCPQLQGDFSLAGHHYSLLPGNPWWAEIEKCHWPENLERDIAPLWHAPYGDRQQEIVIIGQLLDKEEITRVLNACLVSEEEFALGQSAWDTMCQEEGDPFEQDWQEAVDTLLKEGQHDHGHSHEHSHSHH